MYLDLKSIPHSSKYDVLYETYKDVDYSQIVYELDCEPELWNYSVALSTKNDYGDTETIYYNQCNIENSYKGVFRKNITRRHFINNNWKISQWGKIQVICERIEGTLRGIIEENNTLKILVSVPSLAKTLSVLHIEDSSAILEEVRDCLERPYIMVWLTVPVKGYEIEEIGVECRWSKVPYLNILRNLYNLDLISKGVYHHLYYQEPFPLKLEYYKIVFQDGKITESKLYFSPKKKK